MSRTRKKVTGRKCLVTGKKGLSGNRVSHSKRRTRHKQEVNLQTKRFTDENGNVIKLKVSTRAIRTILKKGLSAALKMGA